MIFITSWRECPAGFSVCEAVGMAAWETASLHHSLDVLILTTDSLGAGPAHPETVRQNCGRSEQAELGKTFIF